MTKYIAKLNGQIVGTRTTKDRTYTHAIVVQSVEAWHRDFAYNRKADWIEQDRKNFAYFVKQTTRRLVDKVDYSAADYGDQITSADRARASAIVEAGVDAYIEAQRQQAIASFEQRLAAGDFNPGVASWAGSLALAQKATRQYADGVQRKLVAIVEAEVVGFICNGARFNTLKEAQAHAGQIFKTSGVVVAVERT